MCIYYACFLYYISLNADRLINRPYIIMRVTRPSVTLSVVWTTQNTHLDQSVASKTGEMPICVLLK
jgi:hypothetical protein